MKLNKLILLIPIIVLLAIQTDTALIGGVSTVTSTSIAPFGTDYNTVQTITATTVTDVVWGSNTFAEVVNNYKIGSSMNTSVFSSNSITYSYTPGQSVTVIGFKVPVIDMVRDTNIKYVELVITTGSTVIFQAQLDDTFIDISVNDGYFLFVLGTRGVDIPVADTLTFAAGNTYVFDLHTDIQTQISIPRSESDSDLKLYDNNVQISGSSYIFMLQGSILGTVPVSSGIASISYTIPLGRRTIISYYHAKLTFLPSFDEVTFTATNIDLNVSANDFTMTFGEMANFNIFVTQAGTALANAYVEIYTGTIPELIGAGNTDTFGNYYLNTLLDRAPGSYTYTVIASYLDQSVESNANIVIDKSNGYFSAISASGKYIDGGTTTIYVSGEVRSQMGSLLNNIEVQLSYATTNITVFSVNGIFTHSFITNYTPQIVTDYIEIKNLDTNYIIPTTISDMEITKGDQNIGFISESFAYLDQAVILNGTVIDDLGADIATTVEIFEEINGQYISIGNAVSTGSMYEFEFPVHEAGYYNLQIVSYETVNYQLSSKFIIISVGKSDLQITRAGRGDTAYVEYKQIADLSVLVTDGVNTLSDVDLSYSINSEDNNTVFTFLFNTSTGTDGWSIANYQNNVYSNFVYTVKIRVIDLSFNTIEFIMYLDITQVELIVDANNFITTVGEVNNLNFNTIDINGISIDDGSGIGITIDGSYVYTVYTYSDTITFDHIFNSVGDHTISFDDLNNTSPYFMNTKTITVTVNSGQYIVDSNDVIKIQGTTDAFTAYIHSNAAQNISGISTTLYIYNNGWIQLGSEISDINGRVDISIPITFNPGDYIIRWETTGNINYNAGTIDNTLSINYIMPSIIIDAVDYYYGDTSQATITFYVEGAGVLSNMNLEVIMDTITWNVITDNNGEAIIDLPSLINPGVYNLDVFFSGSANILTVNNSKQIEVFGTATTTQIVQSYSSYYGDWTNFTVLVNDQYGNPLSNIVVELEIDGIYFYSNTNSSGYAYFEMFLTVKGGTYDIFASALANNGYQSSSTSISFTHIIRNLNLQILFPGYYYYGDNFDINLNIYSITGVVEGASINVYILKNGIFELINTISTDINGNAVLIYNNNLDIGIYDVKFEFTHTYYNGSSEIFSTEIVKMPLSYTVESSNINLYGSSSSIEITIYDIHGIKVDNLNVSLGIITDTMQIYAEYTTNNGYAYLSFYPPQSGINTVYILTDNPNFTSSSETIDIFVESSSSYMEYELSDSNGVLRIYYYLYDNNANIINNTEVFNLYTYDNNQWVLIGNNTGLGYFEISISKDTIFRITFIGTNNYRSSTVEDTIILQTANISSPSIFTEYPNIIYINDIFGDTPLDGYSIYYYISGYDGFITTDNGLINLTLTLDLMPGDYQIQFILLQQGWYRYKEWIVDIQISRANPIITAQDIDVELDTLTEINVNVTLNSDFSIIGSKLLLYIDGEFYSSSDIINNLATFIFDAQTLGSYNFTYKLLATSRYNSVSISVTTKVLVATDMKVSANSGYYGISNSIYVELSSATVNLNDVLISIYIFEDGEYRLLIEGIVVDGSVSIELPELLPGLYELRIISEQSGYYMSSKSDLVYRVLPGEKDISYTIYDLGVSNGYIIYMSIDIEGEILWNIVGTNLKGVVDTSGNITIPSIVGDYKLVLSFSNDLYTAETLEIIIGHEKIDTVDIHIDEEIGYGSNITVLISYNDLAINNVLVSIKIDGITNTYSTDSNGLIYLEVNGFPGDKFTIDVMVFSNEFLTQNVEKLLDFSIVRGNIDFSISVDDIYSGDNVVITVEDKYPGVYLVYIDGKLAGEFKDIQIEFFMYLDAGEHKIVVTRKHANLIDKNIEDTFTVKARMVEITIQVTQENDMLIITLTIRDNQTKLIINTRMHILIEIYLDGNMISSVEDYYNSNPQISKALEGEGQYQIKVVMLDDLVGMKTVLLDIDKNNVDFVLVLLGLSTSFGGIKTIIKKKLKTPSS